MTPALSTPTIEEEVPVLNVEVYQGTTWDLEYTLTDDNGAPIPLTGYTALAQVRARPDGPVLLEMASGGAITINGALGQLSIHLTSTETQELKFSVGQWDLFIYSATDEATALCKGLFKVHPNITRAP